MHEWLVKKGIHNTVAFSSLTPLVLNTWLIEAAQQGELKAIDWLIRARATFAFQDMAGYTALSAVVDAEEEDIGLVEYLVGKGAGIHHVHRDGSTLLHCAAERGYVKIAKFLVDNRIKVAHFNYEGVTALHVAARHGYVEVVTLLLEEGSDPNAKDKQLWTPLHYAAYAGHTQTVTVLKRCGARDWIVDKQRKTARDLAQQQGYMETVAVLGGAVTGQVAACHTQVVHDVEDALRVRRFSRGPAIRSGVITSVETNNLKQLCDLIADGAVINMDALHIAVHKGHLKIVIALMLQGVDINAIDENGKTPLHIAAKQGYYDIVNLLLDAQAKIDLKDCNSRAPLHEAAAAGNTKTAELLLKKGAEVWCMTAEGETPYDLAVRYSRTETVAFLKNHKTPLMQYSMPVLYRETTLAMVVAKMDALSSSEPNILNSAPILG